VSHEKSVVLHISIVSLPKITCYRCYKMSLGLHNAQNCVTLLSNVPLILRINPMFVILAYWYIFRALKRVCLGLPEPRTVGSNPG
jgi:hypothetical protein